MDYRSVFKSRLGHILIGIKSTDSEGQGSGFSVSFYFVDTCIRRKWFCLESKLIEILGKEPTKHLKTSDLARIFDHYEQFLESAITEETINERRKVSDNGEADQHQQEPQRKQQEGQGLVKEHDSVIYHAQHCLNESLESARQEAYDRAIYHGKDAVSLSRKALRLVSRSYHQAPPSPSKASPEETRLRSIIAQAYTSLGQCYALKGKQQRSVACYTMACQMDNKNGIRRDSLSEALATLSEDSNTNVDEHLSKHAMVHLKEPLGFTCNSCGECCRERDHILLTPLDLYLMTRSIHLAPMNIWQTNRMFRHNSYGDAFFFTIDSEGYPMCELRPVKSKIGQCHFSYPLFQKPQKAESNDMEEKDNVQLIGQTSYQSSLVGHKVLSFEDTCEYLNFYNDTDHDIEGQNKEAAERWLEKQDRLEAEYADITPIMNKRGHQALGCSLNKSNMPSGCSIFPAVEELTFADNDHVRIFKGKGPMIPAQRDEWQLEENYMLVQMKGCEGFFDVNSISEDGNEGKEIPRSILNPSSPHGTLESYLSDEGNVLNKSRESHWFTSLRQGIKSFLPLTLIPSHLDEIRVHYLHVLTQIFYNFDMIAHLRRPMRSYGRCRRDIDTMAWMLARNTRIFLESAQKGEMKRMDAQELCDLYREVVIRMEIIKH